MAPAARACPAAASQSLVTAVPRSLATAPGPEARSSPVRAEHGDALTSVEMSSRSRMASSAVIGFPPCATVSRRLLYHPSTAARPGAAGSKVQSISQRSPPQLMRQSPGLMCSGPRPAVTTSRTPSRKARCMAQTRSGSAPESSWKVQLWTTTASAWSCQATSGSRPWSSAMRSHELGRRGAVAGRRGLAGQSAPAFGGAGLPAHAQGVLARAARRQCAEREAREQLVAPRREAERDDEIAQPVQLRRPAAAARAPKIGGEEAGLLELGQMHARDVGVEVEALPRCRRR